MPTAGRLAGAIIFFLYGWYIAGAAAPYFTEGNPPDFLIPLCAGIGLLVGWVVCGSRVGRGYTLSVGHGLTAAAAFSFWVIFILSFNEMIRKALRNHYGGPMEAVVDVFDLMVKQGATLANLSLIAAVIIGGIFGALFAEYFAKRYP